MSPWITLSGIALIGCGSGAMEAVAAAPSSAPDLAQVRQRLAALAVPFAPNAGQWDPRAAFAAHTIAGTLFVTTDGQLVYSLPGKEIDEPVVESAGEGPGTRPASRAHHAHRARTPGGVLTETLVDKYGHPLTLTPHGLRSQQAKVSYLIGNEASQHRSALDTFERVTLGELAPRGATAQQGTDHDLGRQ